MGSNIIHIIGGVASALLTIRIFPQLTKVIRQGNARGISKTFLWFWLLGNLLMFLYVVLAVGLDVFLLTNYGFNSIGAGLILRYKYFPTIRY